MKTKTLLFTAIISLGLIFQGCEKETNISKTTLPTKSKTITSHNKSSSGNPISTNFNTYGSFHNDLLDYIATDSDFPNLTNSEILDLAKSYGISVFGTIDSLNLLDASTIDYSLHPFKSISTIATEAYNNSNISNTTKNYLLSLESKIYNHFNSHQYNNLIGDLNTFENTIYNDNTLTVDEKNFVISISVIARYSTEYWVNVSNNNTHPWHSILVNTDESLLPQDVINNLPPDNNPSLIYISYRLMYDICKYAEYISDCPGTGSNCDCSLSCEERAWIGAGVASGHV